MKNIRCLLPGDTKQCGCANYEARMIKMSNFKFNNILEPPIYLLISYLVTPDTLLVLNRILIVP